MTSVIVIDNNLPATSDDYIEGVEMERATEQSIPSSSEHVARTPQGSMPGWRQPARQFLGLMITGLFLIIELICYGCGCTAAIFALCLAACRAWEDVQFYLILLVASEVGFSVQTRLKLALNSWL